MDTFLPSDSHFMVYFVTTGEMHVFSHQSPLCELSGCFSTVLLFLIVPKSIDSLKEKTEKPDKVNSFFKKEKTISGSLEFKAKCIKRRRVNRCNFIKNKEYKCIWNLHIRNKPRGLQLYQKEDSGTGAFL